MLIIITFLWPPKNNCINKMSYLGSNIPSLEMVLSIGKEYET